MNCLLWYGCFSADAVSLAEEKWFLLVAVTIYPIKIIIQSYHVFPGTLTADFTVCPFLLLALQNRFLKSEWAGESFQTTWSITCSLDHQFIKTGACLRHVPETSQWWALNESMQFLFGIFKVKKCQSSGISCRVQFKGQLLFWYEWKFW